MPASSSSSPDENIFETIHSTRHVEPALAVDSAEFEKVVRSRRSTRVYTDERVPESVMRKCLELATLAPNSSNLQCWEFYWIRDQDKKSELVKLCLGQPAAATASELIVCVARLDTWKRNSQLVLEHLIASGDSVPAAKLHYQRKIVPLAYSQGPFYILGPLKKLAIAVMGLFKVVPRGPASKADMRVWAHKTTALACENLMLSLRAFGFDSCPMEGMDEKRVKQLLGLPRAAEVCMVVSAGKRSEEGIYDKQFRLDPSLFIFEV